MLDLDKQNRYRARYKGHVRGWQSSGELYEHLVRTTIAALPAGALIVDIGCGAGGVLELFQDHDVRIVGIDADYDSLQRTRNHALVAVNAIATHQPFPSHCADMAVCAWVMEHLDNPDAVFQEVARILKPGAHWLFLTPNAHNHVTLLNRIIPKIAQTKLVTMLYGRESEDTFPVRYLANTVLDIKRLAHQSQFSVDSLSIVRDPTYTAFNDGAFALSCALERLIPERYGVHIVGSLRKAG